MNSQYIQNIRYKLQKRFRKINSCDYTLFHNYLNQFFCFLNDNPLLKGIIDDLTLRYKVEDLQEDEIRHPEIEKKYLMDEFYCASLAYQCLKYCLNNNEKDKPGIIGQKISKEYGISYDKDEMEEGIEAFRKVLLESLYDYIDEQLDDQRIILSLLRRYKHRCEWFKSQYLSSLLTEKNTRVWEKTITADLYTYLHDQGIDFTIEPSSASGEIDLIAEQNKDDPLVADAKIFNPTKQKDKQYLISGFNQLYTYTEDYNEPFGYLIIFKTCEDGLKFDLSGNIQNTPFISHNGKTIFFIIIDIFQYEKSASQRGKHKTHLITEQELMDILNTNIATTV
jgi:hypothetical protein